MANLIHDLDKLSEFPPSLYFLSARFTAHRAPRNSEAPLGSSQVSSPMLALRIATDASGVRSNAQELRPRLTQHFGSPCTTDAQKQKDPPPLGENLFVV